MRGPHARPPTARGLADRLVPALVGPLVYANVLMMDRYLPGLMSVIYGNVAPAEAVAKAEGISGQAED